MHRVPITDDVLHLPDGRRLAWASWGRADGPPVLLLHTSPGSRLLDPDAAATEAAGIRLVTVDRPGFGGSDSVADPTMAGFAADLAVLVERLGLQRIALLGWSGGGQYAVAAAATLDGRVRSLSLLATPAPDEEVPWVMDEFRPFIGAVRQDPAGAVAPIAQGMAALAARPEAPLETWKGPAEAPIVDRPDVREALAGWLREAVRQGAMGMAGDVVAGSRGDSLPVDRVGVPAHLWYGDADAIGPQHGRWYADCLPHAELTVVPGGGHLFPVACWAAILDAALR